MKIFKTIITILLSFILMIGILSSTLLVIANNYMNKENLLNKFEEINLFSSVYEEIRNGFENYIYQSGLEIDIIDKICSKEKVKNDILTVINSMYGEGPAKLDSSEIRNNLDVAINEYVTKQGRKLSNEEEENIKKFEDLIEESYKEQIGFYQKSSNEIAKTLPKILSNIKKIQIASIGATLLILIILVVVNSKSVSVAGSFAGISLFASGIIMLIAKSIVNSKIKIDNLVLFTKSISSIVVNILKAILNTVQTFGIWYIVVGIIVIVVMNLLSLVEKKS